MARFRKKVCTVTSYWCSFLYGIRSFLCVIACNNQYEQLSAIYSSVRQYSVKVKPVYWYMIFFLGSTLDTSCNRPGSARNFGHRKILVCRGEMGR
ncbi:hypothetical protein DPMN_030272 [Dreissena polymorpha]|uniref:Uncharacterized protein n=1 Tax=Dreissena polymorpha TaxID=45954 RepID=A0A9D4M0T3_DREPO|nr:hypothetical protein DPMN_030272 [Dreissena polymorpha]